MKLQSQEFKLHSIHLSVQEGLPSNEVYDMLQDSRGRLWFCTDNGLSVFDGQDFIRVYDTTYSLIVLGGNPAKNGDLWFFTLDCDLLRLKKGADVPELVIPGARIKHFARKALINEIEFIDNALAIGLGSRILLIRDIDSENPEFEEVQCLPGEIKVLVDGDACIACQMVQGHDSIKLNVIQNKQKVWASEAQISFGVIRHWIASVKKGDQVFLNTSDKLLKVNLKTDEITYNGAFSNHSNGIYLSDSLLWIGSSSDGMRSFSQSKLNLKEKMFTESGFSRYAVDREGGIWLCSQEAGVFYIPYVDMQSYSSNHAGVTHITQLATFKNSVYLGHSQGDVCRIVRKKKKYVYESIGALNGDLIEFYASPEEEIINFMSGSQLMSYDQENHQILRLESRSSSLTKPYDHHITANGKTFKQLLDSISSLTRIRKIFETETAVFFGGFHGSYVFSKKTGEHTALKLGAKTIDLRSAVALADGLHAIGTKGDGLLIYSPDGALEQIRFEDPRLNTITDLLLAFGSLWIVCPDGFFEYPLDNKKIKDLSQIFLVKRLSFQGVELVDEKLFVASDRFFFIFNPEKVLNQSLSPEIYSLEVVHHDKSIEYDEGIVEFSELNANFSVIPKSVSFSNLFHHRYRYRLLPNDSNWQISSGYSIPFFAVKLGSYTLEIQAANVIGSWSENKSSMTFEVIPVFYRSSAFYLIIGLLFSALLIGFYLLRMRQIRRRNLLELQVSESRNKALSTQLNPHFIFNSLNSINSYLALNDSKSAMRFLGKFAKMMRHTFENSLQSYVSLNDELKAIERYVEVEQIRLENKFDFLVEIDAGINKHELFIPSLILQAFVENSIWHGLLPLKDRRGKLTLSVSQPESSDLLEIIIRDNGGHEEIFEKRFQFEDGKSSIAIIRERFEVLTKLSGKTHRIAFRAIPEAEGTEVILIIAVQKQLIKHEDHIDR